jgi:hypothetical protein
MPKTLHIATAAVVCVLTLPMVAQAIDKKTASQIEKLDPSDQLEQRCDLEGMDRLKADKVISYTFSRPKHSDVHIEAQGAVFRRDGEWYRLAYTCTTSADHLSIIAFDMKPGARIPHENWDRYYLYP